METEKNRFSQLLEQLADLSVVSAGDLQGSVNEQIRAVVVGSQNAGNEAVEYKTVRLVTNGGECVMQSALSERHISVSLKKNHWYRAELWGTVNGKEKILAVTSPIYTA